MAIQLIGVCVDVLVVRLQVLLLTSITLTMDIRKHNFYIAELPLMSLCIVDAETIASPCVFPFNHDDMEYDQCVPPSWQDRLYEGSKPWCPMKTNLSGHYDPQFRANCNTGCKVVRVFIKKLIYISYIYH